MAIYTNSLKIIKYLSEKFPDNDINYNKLMIIIMKVSKISDNNKFEMFKLWLEIFDVDIHIRNDYVFKRACRESNLEIIKLIKTKYPKINHNIDNKYIKSQEIKDLLDTFNCTHKTKSSRK